MVVPLALVIFVSYCFGVLLVSRGLDAFSQIDVITVSVCIAGFIGWTYASTAQLTWLSVICVLLPILCVAFNAIRSQGMEG
ncbi:hypothetical protein PAMC26577_21675 [Caballeronia sordidicola]|uniref:Uncharacterized protein n=1 Tax=Caballeronia sordidicola TaxID=196367 RepID=A0A242MLP3_CABSO|nr:hypothetical protein PAMC26577_21675 [Caballeronia sordidicola]